MPSDEVTNFDLSAGSSSATGGETALFVAQADSGIRKPVVVDGEPQIGGESRASGSCSGRPAPASPEAAQWNEFPEVSDPENPLRGHSRRNRTPTSFRKAEFAAVKK